MLQPNPMSLSCSNKTSACCIRSRNQTGCMFDMSFLSYRCFSGSWREGNAWVRLAATFKCAMLIILPLCLRIHLCKHYANVFFGLSLVSKSCPSSLTWGDWCSLDVKLQLLSFGLLRAVECAQMHWIFVIGSKEVPGFEKSRPCSREWPFKKMHPDPFVCATFAFTH